ncbi:hypothetical protein [Natronorarus salvus]|uniref:hypothetical protein n=1 Tax=Natronorarus salvus TaxID=3117733 RepID=UPI002F2651EB
MKQLKREKRHDEVEQLLLWCIDFVEAEAEWEQNQGYRFAAIAPAYYEHLAIVYRKEGRHIDEIQVLERYVDAYRSVGNDPKDDMDRRLKRARELHNQ